jgi:hypothetical protein
MGKLLHLPGAQAGQPPSATHVSLDASAVFALRSEKQILTPQKVRGFGIAPVLDCALRR